MPEALAHEGLPDHGSERPGVRCGSAVIPIEALGGHPSRRADDRIERGGGAPIEGVGARDAEVEQACGTVASEADVAGLEVSVHQPQRRAVGVGVVPSGVEGVGDVGERFERGPSREITSSVGFTEVDAVDVLDEKGQMAVEPSEVVDVGDVSVAQSPEEARLVAQSLRALPARVERWMQDLDRYVENQTIAEEAAAVHLAESASAEAAIENQRSWRVEHQGRTPSGMAVTVYDGTQWREGSMLWLSVERGGERLFRVRLPTCGATIGRADACDVALPGDGVSRIHAEVRPEGDAWLVIDRSRHGLLRDGVPFGGGVLEVGDGFEIAGMVVRLVLGTDVEAATVALAGAGWEELVQSDSGQAVVRHARVRVLDGPLAERALSLTASRVRVGGLGADVVLRPDLPLAACWVRVVRGRALVEPGALPVWLDEIPVVEPTPMLPGDVARCGGVRFVVDSVTRRLSEETPEGFGDLVGRDPKIRRVFGLLERVARHDAPVLVLGETGTGKELAARGLHDASTRHDRPFVALNAAAIPATLIESALFGHERGAFTGAEVRADGAFQRAHRGTLFLDELGELSLPAQARLLRVLESGEVLRVGGSDVEHLDVRIVAATNRDLFAAMREGSFREDLFYRLSVLQVGMPPLRERPADVPLVAETLLRRLHPGARIEQGALTKLAAWSWPGNVRELRNVLTRAVVLHGPWVQADAITFDRPPVARPTPSFVEAAPAAWGSAIADERSRLAALMAEYQGNRSKIARALGIPRTSLIYRLRHHGLSD